MPSGGPILLKILTPTLSRFRKAHGYAHNPAYNLRFPRIGKTAYLAFGIRMRNRRQVTLARFAPTANVFASQLYEIDWPLMLVLPCDRRYLSLILINLDNRPRPDDWVHREIRNTDKAVHAVAEIKMLKEANRNFSPNLNEF